MLKVFTSLFLFFVYGICFGQITPTGNGDVLTYDVFKSDQGLFQSEITFKLNKEQRVLKLNIEQNGDRVYTFMNDKPFAVYNKFFTRTVNRGLVVDMGNRYLLLPLDQKVVLGMHWDFYRKGYSPQCGYWVVNYRAVIKEGPDTSIMIYDKNVVVKTLLIEYHGDAKLDTCTTFTQERFVLYAPGLNEIIMDQSVDFQGRSKTPDNDGYKWVLKSVTTKNNQVPK